MSRPRLLPSLVSAPAILLGVLASGAVAQAPDRENLEIEAAYLRERLTQRDEDWSERRVGIVRRFDERTLLVGKAIDARRPGVADRMLSLSGYIPLVTGATAFAEVAASNPHRALPRDFVHVQLAQSLPLDWAAIVGWKHIRYEATDASTVVDLADLTLEKYFLDYRAALTVFPSYSSTAGNATTYRFQLGYHPDRRSALRISLVKGVEVERPDAFNPVLATPVKSVSVDARHALWREWSVTWTVARTLQETVTRNAAGLGLLCRF